ncbi:molybdate metabolism regulator, first fragment [Shigella sonnei]|nr:molybdate metabolism regulator%2C first fragment [Shigella sonnei]SIY64367.1 molybdate metabolism regulator, first fragment [Shigella sonnei]
MDQIVQEGGLEYATDVIIHLQQIDIEGNDSNLLIVFYVQIMPDDFVMQLHRF